MAKIKKAQKGMYVTERGDTLRGKAAAKAKQHAKEYENWIIKESPASKIKPAPKKAPVKKAQAGLKASSNRVGPVDPKGAWTKVQEQTLAGKRTPVSLTPDKQLGATKMTAKKGIKVKAKGGKWIQKAIKKPGALRSSLGVKKGEKIPAGKLAAAAKKPGKMGQRARLAITLKKMHKK